MCVDKTLLRNTCLYLRVDHWSYHSPWKMSVDGNSGVNIEPDRVPRRLLFAESC